MDFEIEPEVGIHGLALGSTKVTVRQFFRTEPKVFQRTPNDIPADYWADEGVFAYYDGKGTLEALEFASPADVKLDGTSLTAMSMERATQFLQTLDPNVSIADLGASVCSNRLGISVWTPTTDELDAKVEAVLVFGNGYYD